MITYQFNDSAHVLSSDELEAVEMSGRCSWQHYALTPTQWPEATVPFIPLMEARPNAIEPGLRPLDERMLPLKFSPVSELERDFIRRFPLLSNVELGEIIGRAPDTIRIHRNAMGLPVFKSWMIGEDYVVRTARARIWWRSTMFAR